MDKAKTEDVVGPCQNDWIYVSGFFRARVELPWGTATHGPRLFSHESKGAIAACLPTLSIPGTVTSPTARATFTFPVTS